MVRAVLIGLVGVLLIPAGAWADDAPASKPDATKQLLDKLRAPWVIKGPRELTIDELVDLLEAKHGIPVLINDTSFVDAGLESVTAEGIRLKLPRHGLGLSVETILKQCLAPLSVTYLVRRAHLEIVAIPFAIRETKNARHDDDHDGATVMRAPLVCGIYKDKPLNEVVADLAEHHELNIVIAPQSGDQRTAFVTARLLNIPADDALELLALQAELRVVRQGNAYLITNADHANGLMDERLEHERRRIELDNLRFQNLFGPFPPNSNPPKGCSAGFEPGR